MRVKKSPIHKFKRYVWLILIFVCGSLFLSTSFAVVDSVTTVEIGFWSPWYKRVSGPDGGNYEINLLAQSFLSGVAAVALLWFYLRRQENR